MEDQTGERSKESSEGAGWERAGHVGCRLWRPHCALFLCSYIWQHIEIGYVQGMCDLLAPLLVILDDGELSVSPVVSINQYKQYNIINI